LNTSRDRKREVRNSKRIVERESCEIKREKVYFGMVVEKYNHLVRRLHVSPVISSEKRGKKNELEW
jgi:hypothetical protein